MEQFEGSTMLDFIREEKPHDTFLEKTVKKGVYFAVRLRQMIGQVLTEVEESQKLLYEVNMFSISSYIEYRSIVSHLYNRTSNCTLMLNVHCSLKSQALTNLKQLIDVNSWTN